MEPASPPSARSRLRRLSERGRYDRASLEHVLDEGLVAHVGIAAPEGPVVIPMVYGRDGDRLLLHGSVASRLLRLLRDGAEVCVTVTLVDALVLARSQFHHSMNFRSAVIFGRPELLTDPAAKERALRAIVDHLVPGRSAEARPPTGAELRQTHVLSLPLDEASVKVRTGGPNEEPDDVVPGSWGGTIALTIGRGEPVPDPDTSPGTPVPASVAAWQPQRHLSA